MISTKPNKESLLTAIGLCFMILILLFGCTAGNYGKLKSTPEVKREFENYQILPDHKYYYRGTYNSPIAIVGINANYQLNLSLWVPIDSKSKNFRILIDKVSILTTGSTAQPWGFTILDQNGNQVGVWYSSVRAATVKVDENNQIVALSPLPTVTAGYQRD